MNVLFQGGYPSIVNAAGEPSPEAQLRTQAMHRTFTLLLAVIASSAAFAAEPINLTLILHGRPVLHKQEPGSAGYGVISTSLFTNEPVLATVTTVNAPALKANWYAEIGWDVRTDAGEPVQPSIEPLGELAAPPAGVHRLLPNATSARFRLSGLAPGKYLIVLTWTDPATGTRRTSRTEGLAIYRGDEAPRVRSAFLRERAKAALAEQSVESYRTARAMLLEAAEGNTDPSVYEELADASLRWAAPEETATYYQRSLDVARMNLEKRYGPAKEWPEKARSLYEPRARKVEAFRKLVPYYTTNFSTVSVGLIRDRSGDKFVVERRADGKRMRVIDPRE